MCLKVAHSFSSSHRVSSWVFTLSGAVPALELAVFKQCLWVLREVSYRRTEKETFQMCPDSTVIVMQLGREVLLNSAPAMLQV